MMSVANDLHVPFNGHLHSDSSAAIGISQRRGLGKVKHMHTQYLWVQERIRNKEFELHKVPTDKNRADLMTKCLTRPVIDKFMSMLGYSDPTESNSLALKSTH